MMHKRNGSILMIIMLFLGAISSMLYLITQTTYVYARSLRYALDEQRAHVTALNGLTLSLAQLTHTNIEKELEQARDENDKKSLKFANYLHLVNHKQHYQFQQKQYGYAAELEILITCEQSKIPLKALIDPQTKTVKSDWTPLMQLLEQPEYSVNKQKFSTAIINLPRLEEVGDLASIVRLPLFATQQPIDKKNYHSSLFELFSTYNMSEKINPLFLSPSLCKILGLKQPYFTDFDDKTQKETYDQVAHTAITSWPTNPTEYWQQLLPLYGREPKNLKDIAPLLSQEIEPSVFCVISCGIVGTAKVRLLAIVTTDVAAEQAPQEKTSSGKKSTRFQTALATPRWGICALYQMD